MLYNCNSYLNGLGQSGLLGSGPCSDGMRHPHRESQRSGHDTDQKGAGPKVKKMPDAGNSDLIRRESKIRFFDGGTHKSKT